MLDDSLSDFARRPMTIDGETRTVYVAGHGPAVIVMAEMPGISPHVARFARWVRDAGFTVFMPSLFGRDGAYPEATAGLAVLKRACVSAEFQALATTASSPISHWLRGLARLAHDECHGPGVGAIGMCFTGNFALSMMLEPSVLAPVLCQPSLPLDAPSALHSTPEELATIKARLECEDLTVRAYRFAGDRHCTAQRFAAYAAALGPRFEARVLPDAAANPSPPPFFEAIVGCPHSVVTAHLIDAVGEPTIAARDEILAFLAQRLGTRAVARGPVLRLVGRSTSHFTRVAAMFAHELGVSFAFDVVHELTSLDTATYGGHPALKLPTLHIDDSVLFGTDNICRRFAQLAGRADDPRVVLSEHLTGDLERSAQELIWTAMATQVQLRVGVAVAKLPADNVFFAKAAAGLAGTLGWLDARLDQLLDRLPTPRDVSVLEVTLFALVEHIAFFPTVLLDDVPRLRAFAVAFGERASARRTPYRFDSP